MRRGRFGHLGGIRCGKIGRGGTNNKLWKVRGRRVHTKNDRERRLGDRQGTDQSSKHGKNGISFCVGCPELLLEDIHISNILFGRICHHLLHLLLNICVELCNGQSLFFHLFIDIKVLPKLTIGVHITFHHWIH